VTQHDDREAAQLAQAAGEQLLSIRAKIGAEYESRNAMSLGDRLSHELLAGRIKAMHPADAVLSARQEQSCEE